LIKKKELERRRGEALKRFTSYSDFNLVVAEGTAAVLVAFYILHVIGFDLPPPF
jgi:hypothetical protein